MPTYVEAWHWWVAAAVLIVIEVFAPGVLFIWLAIGAALVGFVLLAVPTLAVELQLLLFGVLSVVAVLMGRNYLRRHPVHSDDANVSRRGDQLVGQVFRLAEPITDGAGGRVRVGDTFWRAEGTGSIRADTRVRVVAVKGASLVVEPAETAVEPGDAVR
ncbi:MAG: NfeD family protein [Rhodospirillaceae bacterium]|nr:NfeD family protein [Rhodospirillaceae bacterium]